jgi:hypothetical protein
MLTMLTLKEYCATRRVAYHLVYDLAVSGKIAAGKIGKKWFLDADSVDDYFRRKLQPTVVEEVAPPKEQPPKPDPKLRGIPFRELIKREIKTLPERARAREEAGL